MNLNREICKKCYKENGYDLDNVTIKKDWTEYGICYCPVDNEGAFMLRVVEISNPKIMDYCPYILEHVVSQ